VDLAEARPLVAAVLGRPPASLAVLGKGTDHLAVEVDGSLVARLPLAGVASGAVAYEVRVLDLVARLSPVPVPEVVAADPERGVLVTRKLPGLSLLGRRPADPARIAEQLAGLLAGLRGPDRAALGWVAIDDHPLAGFRAEAAASRPGVAARLTADQRRRVERFLASPLPPAPDRLVLGHNDLGAEHLLTDPGGTHVTGVIDWSDTALADPARDLGRILRDLGPAVATSIRQALGVAHDDALARRAAFHARCALLEDLAHADVSGDARYATAALASFDATFADPDEVRG
jgi:aminoglycoside phosphotransferase (APT) family kinase protein